LNLLSTLHSHKSQNRRGRQHSLFQVVFHIIGFDIGAIVSYYHSEWDFLGSTSLFTICGGTLSLIIGEIAQYGIRNGADNHESTKSVIPSTKSYQNSEEVARLLNMEEGKNE
jgi:hypothetical protein